MGVAPVEGLTGVPPLAASKGGRLTLKRFRAGAVTLLETIRLALDALRSHKLRSFLTLLGVILAVLTLVVVMSVVNGMNVYVADRIANLGANVFIIDRFGIITSHDEWIKAQKRPLITMDDYQRLRDSMKTAKAVAAVDDRNVQVRSGNTKMDNTDVMGVTPNYADVRSLNIAQGRFITEADEMHHAEVVVLGADVAKKFFPNVDPIGKSINAETHAYQVIGVTEPIGSAFGESQDTFMIMPLGTYLREWHRQNEWLGIFVQAPNAEMMEVCQDEARMLMRSRHHLAPGDKDNFGVMGSEGIMDLWSKLTAAIAKSRTTVIFINQIREKIGVMFGNPETTSGGRALKFYASIRLDIRRQDAIKQGTESLGVRTKVKVVKNKLAPPFREAEFDVLYGEGISKTGSVLDAGVDNGLIEKSGTWYTFKSERIGQGRENAKKWLQDNPVVLADLESKLRDTLGLRQAVPIK